MSSLVVGAGRRPRCAQGHALRRELLLDGQASDDETSSAHSVVYGECADRVSRLGYGPSKRSTLHKQTLSPTPVANLQVKVVERVDVERACERRRSGARARIRVPLGRWQLAHAREAPPDRTVSASREGARGVNLSSHVWQMTELLTQRAVRALQLAVSTCVWRWIRAPGPPAPAAICGFSALWRLCVAVQYTVQL